MATSINLAGGDRGLHVAFLGDPGIGQSSILQSFRKEGLHPRDIVDSAGQDRGLFELPVHQSYILDQVVDGEAFRIRFTDSGGLSVYDKVGDIF